MVKLPGSVPPPSTNARSLGPVPAGERFEVTVRVRRRAELSPHLSLHEGETGIAGREYLSREEYEASHGASEQDMGAVADYARQFGLVVVDRSAARRSVFLSGTAAQFSAAFKTSIEQAEHAAGISRRCTSPVHVPEQLAGIVEGVFGIGDLPIARPHFQFGNVIAETSALAGPTTFSPVDVAKLYRFPAGLDGSGQCIAIIELGGGYRTADLNTYFRSLKLPAPWVTSVSVDGGKNKPGQPSGADGEVMLDIEIAGAIAPKATIAVYFAPNTEKGFLDAITMAIHDTVHKPSVISISWGAPEADWSPQAMQSFDQAFQTAAALGVTICCAAGDAGSGDQDPDNGAADGLAHADFPGSSPYVLCCGGTRLDAKNGAMTSEVVWNDDLLRSASGGGVSDVFDLPAYQKGAKVPPSANKGGRIGRGLPDVAGNASPATGYRVRVDGQNFVVGGTSAVAPLWAGLVALMNQKLKKPVGWLNPLLYGPVAGTGSFNDITNGGIGAYTAGKGWDACTGWGSPVGSALLEALSK
jgi:kumamolisin